MHLNSALDDDMAKLGVPIAALVVLLAGVGIGFSETGTLPLPNTAQDPSKHAFSYDVAIENSRKAEIQFSAWDYTTWNKVRLSATSLVDPKALSTMTVGSIAPLDELNGSEIDAIWGEFNSDTKYGMAVANPNGKMVSIAVEDFDCGQDFSCVIEILEARNSEINTDGQLVIFSMERDALKAVGGTDVILNYNGLLTDQFGN